MPWLNDALDLLAATPVCGYRAQAPAATEPTALAAMALAAHGRADAAASALDWLLGMQAERGSLGIDAAHASPCWATGWALLAWRSALRTARDGYPRSVAWCEAADRASHWLLATKGTAEPRNRVMGHDTTLQAWPWVEGTHSWVEPTAIGLLGLKAGGQARHPRCREAVGLLVDRRLPTGGWNQGNKIVLDRVLRAQIEPTGLALAALGGEADIEQSVAGAMDYVTQAMRQPVSATSLSYALIGLTAHRRRPADADERLEAAAMDTLRHGAALYPLALAALAALAERCPWFSDPSEQPMPTVARH